MRDEGKGVFLINTVIGSMFLMMQMLYGGKTSSGWIMRQVGSRHKQFHRVHFARRRDLSYQVSFWVLESAG